MFYFNLENLKTCTREGLIIDEFTLENIKIKKALNVVTREDIYVIEYENDIYILDMPSHRFIKEMQRKK